LNQQKGKGRSHGSCAFSKHNAGILQRLQYIGPDMPGLALKQAVERVLFKNGIPIDADCVAAWLIPDVSDALGRNRSRFAACFDHLRALGDCSRPDIPQLYFADIAAAAASTTLARRCKGVSAEFYKNVLDSNLKLRLLYPHFLFEVDLNRRMIRPT
jgi:hypothetical protein